LNDAKEKEFRSPPNGKKGGEIILPSHRAGKKGYSTSILKRLGGEVSEEGEGEG